MTIQKDGIFGSHFKNNKIMTFKENLNFGTFTTSLTTSAVAKKSNVGGEQQIVSHTLSQENYHS